MISHTFRRVSIRSRNVVATGHVVNDYIAGISNRCRPMLFSSSVRENTVGTDAMDVGTTSAASEVISFPATADPSPDNKREQPVLLNSKEHAVGYLNRILNARVYEAAIETELQHAENLSEVR